MEEPQNTANPPLVPAPGDKRSANYFSGERARLAALRSAAVRRAKRDRRLYAKKLAESRPPTPPQNDRIKRLEDAMRDIEKDFKGANADVKAKLAAAHRKLFETWQTLTETPRPPVARIRGRRTPQSFPTPEPEPAQVAQVTPAPEPAPEPAPAPIVVDTPQQVVVQEPEPGT